jgi:hypothetical protein
VDKSWEWQEGQFSYELVLDQNTLLYVKHLRHGGHIPTEVIPLVLWARRRSNGDVQEGEERVILDLRTFERGRIGRLPYRGYSAFRMPLLVLTGIGCVAPFFQWRKGKDGGLLDGIWILGPLLIGFYCMREVLAWVFPPVGIELRPKKKGSAVRIDLHGLPETQRQKLSRALARRLA